MAKITNNVVVPGTTSAEIVVDTISVDNDDVGVVENIPTAEEHAEEKE